MLETGNVVRNRFVFPANLLRRVDFVVLVQTEQDRAVKPMMFRE